MAQDDKTFHHPELATIPGAYGNGAAPAQSSACQASSGQYLSPSQYQNSGIAYSAGCNSCGQTPMASDESIDVNQLNDMINALVKALRGE